MKIKTEIERITPQSAKHYLTKANPNNRNISQAVVVNYSREMKNGNWLLNGEPITFDSEGVLQNGHHRLAAIAQSGVTITCLVVRGTDPDSFYTYDSGKVRSHGDVLKMHGIDNGAQIAAICQTVLIYNNQISVNRGEGGSWNTWVRPTKAEVIEFYERNTDLLEDVYRMCRKGGSERIKIAISDVSAVMFIAAKSGAAMGDVVRFIDQIGTGTNLRLRSPAYQIRKLAGRAKTGSGLIRYTRNYLRNALIYSWNACYEGRDVSQIRILDANKVLRILPDNFNP